MMRIMAALVLLCCSAASGYGQTWSEWFSQKKTQQKYLLEQLAALKLYAGYLKKGYEVSRSGLGFIKDVSREEFDLHGQFFSKLKTVSPQIRGSGKITAIIDMQLSILQAIKAVDTKSPELIDHAHYLRGVKETLNLACLEDMEELLLTITSGRLEMTDDERMDRIDKISISMYEKDVFAREFCAAILNLKRNRINAIKQIKEMEAWYEK